MSNLILIAGATGSVGRALVAELAKAEQPVRLRVLARNPERAAMLRGLSAPPWVGDATVPAALAGSCDGVDVVFSSLGASVSPTSRDRRSYLDVDLVANRNLLAEAKRAGVRRFVYVSVFTRPAYEETAYVRAHEQFVAELKASGLEYGVLRPTGLFSAFSEMLAMARKGRLPLIAGGAAETNPLSEADLAILSREAIFSGDPRIEIDVGGPEVLSRRKIAALVFEALGRRPRFVPAPKWIMNMAAIAARPFNRRFAELLAFVTAASTTACVATPFGSHRLSDYLRARAV